MALASTQQQAEAGKPLSSKPSTANGYKPTDAPESSDTVTACNRTTGRSEWIPIPISQLTTQSESVPWLWGAYIAKGHITSLTALWKSGKTTLLKYLLKAFDGSECEFCGQAVIPAKVLVISEESPRLWIGRRDELGLGDNVHLICKPFMTRPRLDEWITFIALLLELQQAQSYDLIVFDSMHNLWGVQDERDNSEVLRYLTPLNMLTQQGLALLLLAHPTKADSTEGRATRGGGAWGGFVDIILEMRRFQAVSTDDTRRVLKAYSRWDETPAELVVELDKDAGEYRLVGTKADAHFQDRMAVYADLLPKNEPGMTPEEILNAWPEGEIPKPSERTIKRDLDPAKHPGKVKRTGGVKGDPYRYSMLDT